MSDRNLSVLWRTAMLAAVLALPVITGCGTTEIEPEGGVTPEGPRFVATPMHMVLDALQTQDSNWETLQAKCKITFHHPELTPNIGKKLNPMRFSEGAIYIDKGPTRRRREVDPKRRARGYLLRLDFGGDNVIVSDGRMYMGRIRELGVQGVQFRGVHGEMPYTAAAPGSKVYREVEIPLSADDIIYAIEPFAALRGLPLIMKQTPNKLELMALGLVSTSPSRSPDREESSKVLLKRGVEMSPENKLTRWVYRYDRNGFPWSFILVRERAEVEGAMEAPVQIPSRIWMHYPQTRAVVDIELSDIQLDVVIDPKRFELKTTIHTGDAP